jgi:phosphoserine aminotransferase
MTRVFNFSAGPAALPLEVLEQLRDEMLDWHGQRHVRDGDEPSRQGVRRHRRAGRGRPARAARGPANYKVLFLQGGATGQFAAIPLNLARPTRWSTTSTPAPGRRRRSARRSATARSTSRPTRRRNYSTVPRRRLAATPRRGLPALHAERDHRRRRVPVRARRRRGAAGRRHVVDDPVAPLDVSRFGVIYAGAQKNIGPAGLVVVIVRDDLLGRARPDTPTVFDWKAMAADGSMLNTPATFGWYVAGSVFQWIKRQGGLAAWSASTAPRPSCCTPRSTAPASTEPGRPRVPLVDERAVHAAERRARQAVPRGRQGRASWRSKATARWAACAPASTTPCRWQGWTRACRRWSRGTCASSSSARLRPPFHVLQDPHAQQHLRARPRAAAARSLRSGLGDRPPDAILVRSADMHAMDIPASVLAVARAGAGTNNMPVAKLSKRGVPVFNAPGANANAVKELVLAGLFLRRATSARPGLRAFARGRRPRDRGRPSRRARRSSSATSCRAARWAWSASARSASRSPTRRSGCA